MGSNQAHNADFSSPREKSNLKSKLPLTLLGWGEIFLGYYNHVHDLECVWFLDFANPDKHHFIAHKAYPSLSSSAITFKSSHPQNAAFFFPFKIGSPYLSLEMR